MTIEEMDQVDQREVDRRGAELPSPEISGMGGIRPRGGASSVHAAGRGAPVLLGGILRADDDGYLPSDRPLCPAPCAGSHGQGSGPVDLQRAADSLRPVPFEACVYHMGFCGNSNLKQLNLAVAQYYQGSFRQAMDTVMHTDPSSFKKTNRLNYYIIKSALFFRFGEKEQVSGLENEFQRRISGREDQKNMRILCAVNNLKRARENGDLEFAWKFFWEYLALADRGRPGAVGQGEQGLAGGPPGGGERQRYGGPERLRICGGPRKPPDVCAGCEKIPASGGSGTGRASAWPAASTG